MTSPLRLAAAALLALCTPSLALAHPGLHHHPHGIEGIWGVTLLALGVGLAAIYVLRGRK